MPYSENSQAKTFWTVVIKSQVAEWLGRVEMRYLYTATINKIERESLAPMLKRYTSLKMLYRNLLSTSYSDTLMRTRAAEFGVRLSREQAAL